MWLGGAPWQVDVRRVLEQQLASMFGNCPSALAERAVMARALGLRVDMVEWAADHSVDADWVLGHLGGAMDADQLSAVRAPLEEAFGAYSDIVEHVTTTALFGAKSLTDNRGRTGHRPGRCSTSRTLTRRGRTSDAVRPGAGQIVCSRSASASPQQSVAGHDHAMTWPAENSALRRSPRLGATYIAVCVAGIVLLVIGAVTDVRWVLTAGDC